MDGSLVVAAVGVLVSGSIGIVGLRKSSRIEINVDGRITRMEKRSAAQSREIKALRALVRVQDDDREGDPSAEARRAATLTEVAEIDTEIASGYPARSPSPAVEPPDRPTGPENP